MRSIDVTEKMASLLLGRKGENNAVQYRFPVEEYLEEYPGATIGMYYRLPHHSDSYPVVIGQPADGYVAWTVGSTELQKDGDAECELVVTKDGAVKLSKKWKCKILDSLDGGGDAPDPWESWMTEFTAIKGEAEDAAEAAEDAQTAAETAQGKAEDAQEAAEIAQGKAEDAQVAAETAQGKAEDAQVAAETAATAAQNIIDDTATTQTTKTWSAGKVSGELAEMKVYKFSWNVAASIYTTPVTLNLSAKTWSGSHPTFSSGARVVAYNMSDTEYYTDLEITIDSQSVSGSLTLLPGASSGTIEVLIADTETT